MVSIKLKQKVFILLLQDLLKDLSIWYPNVPDFLEYRNLIKAFETNLSGLIYPDFEKKIIQYSENIRQKDIQFFLNLHYSDLIEESNEYYSKFDLIKEILESPETTDHIRISIWLYMERFLKIAES